MNKSTTAVSIKPQRRVTEFPGEHLTVSNGKLCCVACREELNLKKKLAWRISLQSIKTVRASRKLKNRIYVVQGLQRHNGECHLRVETFPLEQQVFHVKVVRLFLCAAVPLKKLDCFRDLLEEHAWCFIDRCIYQTCTFHFEGGKLKCNLVVEQVGGVSAADGTIWRSWAIPSEEFIKDQHTYKLVSYNNDCTFRLVIRRSASTARGRYQCKAYGSMCRVVDLKGKVSSLLMSNKYIL